MKAKFKIIVRYEIVQDVDDVKDLISPHDIAQTSCNILADELTDFNAVTSYEILSGKVDIK